MLDKALDAIANSRRRQLLLALLEQNPIDDTPAIIADDDAEAEAIELLIELNHVHLPKLEEYGFIEWDRDTHEVIKGPQFDEIQPLLELLANHEDELPSGWL